MSERERAYMVWLSSIAGIGAKRMLDLCRAYGSAQNVFENATRAGLLQVHSVGEQTASALLRACDQAHVEDANRLLEQLDITAYLLGEPGYPQSLCHIPQPPPILFATGARTPQLPKMLAMVGTRRPTRYGRKLAHDLAAELAKNGVTIVSGMARGIDACAHQGAIDAGGCTVAVLGCGVDVVYPKEHQRLYAHIRDSGVILSEYFPTTAPLAGNFPARNRIISGMSEATFVIESRERGGSLITANFAMEEGKEVFVLPGNVDSPASMGTNRLMRDGATPVLEAQDLLDAMRWETTYAPNVQSMEQAPVLDPMEQAVYNLLEQGDLHFDQLVEQSGQAVNVLATCLTLMEIRGIIKQLPGRIYALNRQANTIAGG